MKKHINKLNYILINKPWMIMILSILYLIILRSTFILCEDLEYWDLPYEKSPELEEQIKKYKERVQMQEINTIHMDKTESVKEVLDARKERQKALLPLEKLSQTLENNSRKEIETVVIEETLNKKIPAQLKGLYSILQKKKELFIAESPTLSIEQNDLKLYVISIYEKIYITLRDNKQSLDLPSIKKAVFDSIMTNPHTGIWIPKGEDDVYNESSTYSQIISIIASDVNLSKNKSTTTILRTVGTITCIIGSVCIREPITPDFNFILEARVYPDECFDPMRVAFDNICLYKKETST